MTKLSENILSSAFIIILLLGVFCFNISYIQSVDDTFHIWFIDVGQGDGILMKSSSNQYVLIDCGPNEKITNQLKSIIPTSLSRIDVILITHFDKDHYGGIGSLIENYTIGKIIINQKFKDEFLREYEGRFDTASVISVYYPDKIHLTKDLTIDVLWPNNFDEQKSKNNYSSVLLVRHLQNEFLLTGDIDAPILEGISFSHNLNNLTVFKVPHHGSKNGLSNHALDQISPAIGIISVGKSNQYHHPHKETIDLFSSYNWKNIFRTDQNETIHIICEQRGCFLEE